MGQLDADALEREGWSLCRTFQKDKDTMVYEVKKPSDFPTIEDKCSVCGSHALPPAQPEQRWIPCSERLPEYGCPVLWCNENGSVFVSAITVKTDHGWAIGKRHRMCKVIAWMSLPEPYQTERREE